MALRSEGWTQADAAKKAGFSYATAQRIEKNPIYQAKGAESKLIRATETIGEPKDYDDLCDEAKRALEDFTYFQERYLGRIGLPWQKDAAEKLEYLLETENEEYVVVNAPPGSGKSTIFVHDIPLWMIVRNRNIRIMIGSATFSSAKKYVRRLRRTLESVEPLRADVNELRRGEAMDAVASLAVDFGRFRPVDRDLWTGDTFVVAKSGSDNTVSEKEATVTAYGIDSSFIGQRVDGAFWDDLVDPRKTRTSDQKDALQEVFQDVVETRLEPGGLLVLQGQRLDSTDLYRFALDLNAPYEPDDDNDEEATEVTPLFGEDREGKKYHHLVYRAHYEDNCNNLHKKSSPPWPEGCLLSPRRLHWGKLSSVESNSGERYRVLYQQEDVDPSEVLVPNAWVFGGDEFVGCIDRDRNRLEIPAGLDPGSCISIATADPSPTNYWSVQWWIYDPNSERRYLIDLLRKKMDAPDFLDWDATQHRFVGVMDEWQDASRTLGFPITTWIVEANAAQRFMLQYDHVRRWRSLNSVDILPHTTSRNKSDPQYGVETIAPHWRFGRVRLPGFGDGKVISMRLIDEVTKYPHGRTDDCVMAEWFFEWNLPNLSIPIAPTHSAWRPSWIG